MTVKMLAGLSAAALLLAACGDKAASPPAAAGDQPASATEPASGGSGMPAHIPAPKRNPGWWEFTDVAPNGDELSKTNLCIGEQSEAKFSAFDQISRNLCSSQSFTQEGDGWTYTTVCGVPGMKPTTTKGKLTGDISTSYRMDEVLDISVEGDHQARTAKLISPTCPEGYKDGDESTLNGAMKSSVLTGR